jgi:Kinesin-associated protein (KAP)
MLERNNADLLVTTLYFLKKLSIIGENKDQMVLEGIIDRMPRFFKQNNEPLMHLALRLLINLSFDKKARYIRIPYLTLAEAA